MNQPIDLTYPRKFVAVQSSVTPDGYDRMKFNDLACLHASRSADGMWRRMKAAFIEIVNEI